jgi:hypothetical protein
MNNPWMKKNPLMSMWMSGANAVLGSARGRATAGSMRQATAMTTNAAAQTMRFWTSVMTTRRGKKSAK